MSPDSRPIATGTEIEETFDPGGKRRGEPGQARPRPGQIPQYAMHATIRTCRLTGAHLSEIPINIGNDTTTIVYPVPRARGAMVFLWTST